jgi:AcrR family transcriptional regulator
VRKAAGVSGSQLSHYFRDKESLVRAVIAWRADLIIDLHKIPLLGGLDYVASFATRKDHSQDLRRAESSGVGLSPRMTGAVAAERRQL